MSEFGHVFSSIPGAIYMDTWGVGPFVIEVDGKRYSFEDCDRFGPLLLRRNGSPLENQPGERHAFWKGYTPWRHQGRRVENGLCVWEPFKPDKVRAVMRGRKKFIELIEPGNDPFGSFEVVGTVRSDAA